MYGAQRDYTTQVDSNAHPHRHCASGRGKLVILQFLA
jgi:hypothetical protein